MNVLKWAELIKPSSRLRYKNETNNSQNNNYRCFQYPFTITESNRQRVSNIKPFINVFNLDGVDYPTSKNEFEERNNWNIGLFMLYVDVEVTSFKDNDGKYTNSIN